MLFAICTSPLIHLVCPSKFCITFVFLFFFIFPGYYSRPKRIANEAYAPNGSLYVAGKLPPDPSPKPTITLTSHLGQNVGLGEG